jgi:hypothetical protein
MPCLPHLPVAAAILPAAPRPEATSAGGSGVVIASIVLLLLAILGVIVALRVRSWARDRGAGGGGSGFTLEQLQALRDRGELTEVQWQAARRSVLEGVRSGAASTQGPETSSPRSRR